MAILLALALPGAAQAASPFAWRGIVEGPYGQPWDHGQRERVLRWMPAHGFNAYVHAPKDDPYQRAYWRDPYPPDELAKFASEAALARARGVEWIPNISPALPLIPSVPSGARAPSRDLCFSCDSDLRVVMDKLEPFVAAGTRTVMVSFDDVSKVMTHPEDLAHYGMGDEAFGRANGDFLTRLREAFAASGRDVDVLTVGADYSGTGDTAYLRGLRATLDPRVEVMWTGTNIPSEHWTPDDARAYGERIGRRPLVWDNWTNNDTAGNAVAGNAGRIFLGPYRRRPDVASTVSGFFLNPMNEADLNLLPLATAGAWMDAPQRYRPRAAWLAAVRELARPRRLRQALRAWSETSYSTRLGHRDAPTFAARRDRFLAAYRETSLWRAPARSLLVELSLAEHAGESLRALRRRHFAEQAGPWLDAARTAAGAGRLGTELLGAERPALSVARRGRRGFRGTAAPPDPDAAASIRSRYRDAQTATRSDRRFVYGWRAGAAFDVPPYEVPENAMSVYFDAVDELDGAWQQRASDAAGGVTVTLGARTVPLDERGRFRLGRRACGRLLVATDGAGGHTGRRLPRCR